MNREPQSVEATNSIRLCHRCGRPTPRQAAICIHCAAKGIEVIVLGARERADQRFVRAFLARATPMTYFIFGLNLLIYTLMAWTGEGGFVSNLIQGTDGATLMAFGAKSNGALAAGDWFRLVTPIFLHIGALHIFSNSYALAMVGPQVERLYGSARFLLIYLLAGVAGVVGSVVGRWSAPDADAVSAGASGALFGLFGVLAVFGYKYRRELPESFRRGFAVSVIPAIIINLIIGFSVPFIDNSAHIGLRLGSIFNVSNWNPVPVGRLRGGSLSWSRWAKRRLDSVNSSIRRLQRK